MNVNIGTVCKILSGKLKYVIDCIFLCVARSTFINLEQTFGCCTNRLCYSTVLIINSLVYYLCTMTNAKDKYNSISFIIILNLSYYVLEAYLTIPSN